MIDRVKGSVTALHLPDYDPFYLESRLVRDYAAYCGLTASGKHCIDCSRANRRTQAGEWDEEAFNLVAGRKPIPRLAPPRVVAADPLAVTFQRRTRLRYSYSLSASPLSWWKKAMER